MLIKTYKRGSRKVIKQPKARDYNFLKYLRVVRYYIKSKYEISLSELDMLLYLYDLPVFKKEEFNYYGNTMSWDKHRFYDMKKKGFIKEWRPGGQRQAKARLYELSHKSKIICSLTYKKLMAEEPISEDPRSNPLFKSDAYMDKIYRNVIKKMNESRNSNTDEQPF